MGNASYEEAVKSTFELKPLRTVLLIDDEFPTFSDLAQGETKASERKFRQKDRAVNLYRGFQSRQMICDVENEVGELHIGRFRKSDLIILDYHLGPDEHDSESAIRLLRDFASSKHFNTVVVYTAEKDIDLVWLDIMATLSGGWTDFIPNLDGEASEHWEALTLDEELPGASREATLQYARRRSIRDLDSEVLTAARKELLSLGVSASACNDIITAMIHRELGSRAGKYAEEPQRPTVGNYEGNVRWIQTMNSFVCVLQKDGCADEGKQADRLMSYLGQALLSWRPNLIQVLISEIQNVLELEALATADDLLRDPVTQTALWYYLLETLGFVDVNQEQDVKAPLVAIIDKVLDGVRRKLSTDKELLGLVGGALLGELRDVGWDDDTWPKAGHGSMTKGAQTIARTDGLVQKEEVLFRLNSFFSTEAFSYAQLTTGTICRGSQEDEYIVIASPACDLVARSPSSEQEWLRSVHPTRPIVCIKLRLVESVGGALSKAARGQHIFVEEGGSQKAFKIVNDVGQPSFEFLLAKDEGRVRKDGERVVVDVSRIVVGNNSDSDGANGEVERGDIQVVDSEFEVVGQLRDMNATRVLQLTGHHLSRIGLEFVNMPA